MGGLSRTLMLVGIASIAVLAPTITRSQLIHAAPSTDMVMVAEDVTDWTHCTAMLTAVDGQGHTTTVWSGQCGQGPVGGAVIRFSVTTLATAEAAHQQYEPIAAGEAGRLRLTQAIVAQHRAASGQSGAATTPSTATPNGSCLAVCRREAGSPSRVW